MTDFEDYGYQDAAHPPAHDYLYPPIKRILGELSPMRVFDMGCGNGAMTALIGRDYPIMGIDISESGIAVAKAAFPHLKLQRASVYDDLAERFGRFDTVTSLEVIEHLYSPRLYARRLYDLVLPGGHAVVSTPYHGYLKNLAMAVTGRLDGHFTALWEGGHIKFWSMQTLSTLLTEAGFERIRFHRAGRIPVLAKSMIAIARKPEA